jgi:NAD-dependent dihydropyrimidine dehydrogenase PreA subunit
MPKSGALDLDCNFEPGVMVPVIDPMRREAVGPCIPIGPHGVLALHVVPRNKKAKLPLTGRLRLFVRGGQQAIAGDPDACRGRGSCVLACPGKVMKLRKC